MKTICISLFVLIFGPIILKAQLPGILDAAKIVNQAMVTYTDEAEFVSIFSSFGYQSPDQIDLNRSATTSGFKNVYGFNIPDEKDPIGFKWNKADEETNEWRPQGIAGFQKGNKRFLIVTWYAIDAEKITNVSNNHKGARISIVDITNMNTIRYRHILLVQNIANKSNPELFDQTLPKYTQLKQFIPVTTHAGGVTFFAGKIYVADTHLGIRVFDLNKIVAAETNATEDSIGNNLGKLYAFNYAYLLPQSGYYNLSTGDPFSSIEIGEGNSPTEKIVWTGQYFTEADAKKENRIPKVYGFSINSQGTLSTPVKVLTPKDNDKDIVYGMQGVYRAGNKTYMTITGAGYFEGSTARLVTYTDGAEHGVRYRWPHGAEDLYLEKMLDVRGKLTEQYLWCLTEYETAKNNADNRCVFAVKLSGYD